MAKIGPKPMWNQLETFKKLKSKVRRSATVSLIGDLIFFLFSLAFIVNYAFFIERSESLCSLTVMTSVFRMAYFLNHANIYLPFFDIVERDVSGMQTTHHICVSAILFVDVFEIGMVIYMQHTMPVKNIVLPPLQIVFALTQCVFSAALDRWFNLSLEELFSFMFGPGPIPPHIPLQAPTPDVEVQPREEPKDDIPQIIVTID
ncbi:hypothetical protein CAEBREN_12006 [Caenorhabditis brenneri]|uniref:Uncharacterized protein n=1 Tax=Caenorhabditis brenneri TaxID=135651 RepID=G0MW57_CAEBE|nr:hypothetical protein CAEBREN_12006 [Caenorhabditis brenneri]